MAQSSSEEDAKEIELLRETQRTRVALLAAGAVPSVVEALHHEHLFERADLPSLVAAIGDDEQGRATHFKYRTGGTAAAATAPVQREWRKERGSWGDSWDHPRPPKEEPAIKEADAILLATETLRKGGASLMSREAKIEQMKTSDLLQLERVGVEARARLVMRREKEAENFPEANSLSEVMAEWRREASRMLQLHEKDFHFSVVSSVEERGEKEESEEEEEEDTNTITLSFSTRFDARNYSITVQLSNDAHASVHTFPVVHGFDEALITNLLSTSSLLDAITTTFWNLLVKQG